MEEVRVKICGITNLADARYSAGAGADYLGFIQSEASPRYVEPDTAKEIIDWLAGVKTVGVFVNADIDHVNRVSATSGFDLVQLHGDESEDYCAMIERPVIKAIRIRGSERTETIKRRLLSYVPHVHAFLFDTFVENVPGGTGTTFPWSIVADLELDVPVFLAGGINPSNVVEAVAAVRPFCVDVSSGVEEAPGRKDFSAVDNLFRALRGSREG